MASNAKTIDGSKKLLPKSPVSHNSAQFAQISHNSAQSPASCFNRKQTISNPETPFPQIVQKREKNCAHKKSPTQKPSEDKFWIPINGEQSRSMAKQQPRNCFNLNQTTAFPKTTFSPLIANAKPFCANATGLIFRIEHSGQWCSMAEQSLNNCFGWNQKDSAPKPWFSPLFNNGKNHWSQKKSYPNKLFCSSTSKKLLKRSKDQKWKHIISRPMLKED